MDTHVTDAYKPINNPDALGGQASPGEILLLNGRYDESIDFLIKDLDNPSFARYATLSNLGIAYRYIGAYAAATNALSRALMEKPDCATAWHNFSTVLTDMGEIDAAFQCASNAHRLWPGNREIQHSMGAALLREGKWQEGWPVWDSGRYCAPRTIGLTLPEWHIGLPTDGKKVLVLMDGGYGDTFLFLRYCALLKDAGATVTVIIPHEQLTLLAGHPFVDRLIGDDGNASISQADFDYFIPGMSLPAAFDSLPSTVPYPDAHLLRDFPISHTVGQRRIGICWKAGEPVHSRKFRSYLPAQLDALRDVGNAEWQSLVPKVPLDWASSLEAKDWLGTASVISSLDLVISVDTAVAHLSAMMGKPTWLLLHAGADWKWLRNRTDSVWWSSVRLFRSDAPDDFLTLPEQVAKELR